MSSRGVGIPPTMINYLCLFFLATNELELWTGTQSTHNMHIRYELYNICWHKIDVINYGPFSSFSNSIGYSIVVPAQLPTMR